MSIPDASAAARRLRQRQVPREATTTEREIIDGVKDRLRNIAMRAESVVKAAGQSNFRVEAAELQGFAVSIRVISSEVGYSQRSERPMKRGTLLNLTVWRLGEALPTEEIWTTIAQNGPYAVWRALHNLPASDLRELLALKLPLKWQPAAV